MTNDMNTIDAGKIVTNLFDTMIELNWSSDEINEDNSANDAKNYNALIELTGKENTVFSYMDNKFSVSYSEYEFKVSRAKYEINFEL